MTQSLKRDVRRKPYLMTPGNNQTAPAPRKVVVQKYCKKHGKQHIIDSNFSLCCHPDCFGSVVFNKLKNNRSYKHIKSIGAIEDFHSWIQIQLLAELREKGKSPILNNSWLYYRVLTYYNMIMKKGAVPEALLPTKARDERVYLELNETIIDEIENNIAEINTQAIRPDRQYMSKEIIELLTEQSNSAVIEYLLEEINIIQYCKLMKYNMTDAKKNIEEYKQHLQKFINEKM